MIASAVITYDTLTILIEDILHLSLTRSKLLAVHSYMLLGEGKFYIEYTLVGGVVVCDYDTREKWQAVLKELGRVL